MFSDPIPTARPPAFGRLFCFAAIEFCFSVVFSFCHSTILSKDFSPVEMEITN